MPRGKPYSPEIRARVVAEIAQGDSIVAVSQRWGVSRSRAVEWWQQERPVGLDNAHAREAMAGLVYGTLSDLLAAVRIQLQAVTDKEWLAQQTAGELAQLLGAEVDRAVRLLAGFRPAAEALPDPDDNGPDRDNQGRQG